MTSVLYVIDYFIGFPLLGIIFYVLNGILVDILVLAPDGDLLNFANMIWGGVLILYIIVGFFWLPRKIKEWEGMNK